MTSQNRVPPRLDRLAASASATSGKALPPVHLWTPPFQGDIDITIARDGTWWHEGRPILREALVRLFASILRRDPERYVLVTPVECVGITVEDAPFVAVDVDVVGTGETQSLTFHTNVGDTVVAGPDAPLRVESDPQTEAPSPYVMVRAGLEARIDRKTFYRLADHAVEHPHGGADCLGVWSGGVFFPLYQPDTEPN